MVLKARPSYVRPKAIHGPTRVTLIVNKGATLGTATGKVGSRKLITRVDTVVFRSRGSLGIPLSSLAALIRFRSA
jgi:hypothetical protein